jgi:hypothetical protein
VGTEERGGAGGFGGGDVFGVTLRNDFASGFPALRAEIDQVIRFRKDIEVMLDHHNRVTGFDQPM